MKKIIPYILIFVTILQLFAPFSVGVNNKKLAVSKNNAEAYNYNLGFTPISGENYIKIEAQILKNAETGDYTNTAGIVTSSDLHLYATLYEGEKERDKKDSSIGELTGKVTLTLNGSLLNKLDPDTTYKVVLSLKENIDTITPGVTLPSSTETEKKEIWTKTITVKTIGEGEEEVAQKTVTTSGSVDTIDKLEKSTNYLPICDISHIGGCIAQGLYYILFVPTSALFGLTGKFLDFTVMYSLSDSSYRSDFVVNGWGLVRDFCNMFFIFVLLYVAFGTILNLHSVKTQEMIINVIIIGLLINFSLFATRFIIDTSNILARVFYNQQTIVTGSEKDADGNTISELGDLGEIKLSEAIVTKVNPQKLIINAKDVGAIPIKGQALNEDKTPTDQGITTGTFILVTLLATAVNIFGLIAFLSCGIIFVSRVIGLWLAMILVPLVFFSYTVPALQNMKLIGWKHWWPETLQLAFLAPIFTFFMYIIVGFMDKGLDIIDASGKTGLNFVIAIIVPFIFIIVLLMKAKDIAKDMSGTIGQSITNGINTIGGMALGGAALGGAALGRNIIGKGLAAVSRTEGAKNYGTQKIAFNKKLEEWKAKDPATRGNAPTWKEHAEKNGVKRNPLTFIGGKLNQKQMEVGNVDHARHEEDEAKKAAGLVDTNGQVLDNSRLTGSNIESMQKKYDQTKRGDAEAAARKGVDAKGKKVSIEDTDGNRYEGEEDFRAGRRKQIIDDMKFNDPDSIDANGELTDEAKKKVENKLNVELNVAVKAAADIKLKDDFAHMREEASRHVNPATRSFAGVNKNSFDIRKLSEMKTDARESLFSKGTIGLAALIATGVRSGLKGSGFGNSKVKVEGNFMKDLGNTISDSLKSMKVNVDLSHVGEHKSSADAHGGDHGGGHH